MKIYGDNGSSVSVSRDETVVVVVQGYFLLPDGPLWTIFCSSNMSQAIDIMEFPQQIIQRGRLESQALLSVSQRNLDGTSCTSYVIVSKMSQINVSVMFLSINCTITGI
jgi:hypothetical protein